MVYYIKGGVNVAKARERVSTGLSIKDISKMSMEQFESYTPKQQREIVSRLGSAVNKRFSKLESRDIVTPATIRLEQSGGRISVKGKSGEELKRELFRAKQYLRSKTSTLTGYKQLEKKLGEESQRKHVAKEGTDVSIGIAFSYYDILVDTDPNIRAMKDKYKIVEFIADKIDAGLDYDATIDETFKYLESEYKKEQKRYKDMGVNFGDTLNYDLAKRYRRVYNRKKR